MKVHAIPPTKVYVLTHARARESLGAWQKPFSNSSWRLGTLFMGGREVCRVFWFLCWWGNVAPGGRKTKFHNTHRHLAALGSTRGFVWGLEFTMMKILPAASRAPPRNNEPGLLIWGVSPWEKPGKVRTLCDPSFPKSFMMTVSGAAKQGQTSSHPKSGQAASSQVFQQQAASGAIS